jgi:hypothetical protein
MTFCIPVGGQQHPLTAHIQHLPDVVEGLVQAQRGRRSTTAPTQMRNEKFGEQLNAQFHGNHWAAWASSHSVRPEIWTLPDRSRRPKTQFRASRGQIRYRQKN